MCAWRSLDTVRVPNTLTFMPLVHAHTQLSETRSKTRAAMGCNSQGKANRSSVHNCFKSVHLIVHVDSRATVSWMHHMSSHLAHQPNLILLPHRKPGSRRRVQLSFQPMTNGLVVKDATHNQWLVHEGLASRFSNLLCAWPHGGGIGTHINFL